MKKKITFDLPPFLTIGQYQKMNSYKGESSLQKLITLVHAVTEYSKEEIMTWDIKSLTTIAEKFKDIASPDNEFHSLVEWNGQLYGYAHMSKSNIGEYVDLENLTKDFDDNLHKIAALLYRPITDHNFESLSFTVKQKLKMVNNKVENVFDYYNVEPYDSNIRKKREREFIDFPIHILLGAISFFLTTGNLSLTTILSSNKSLMTSEKRWMEKTLMANLLENTGHGGGLSTTSLSPTYLRLQGIER